MTTFDDREKAAENKYAHDQENEFRVHARRNKLLGLWAAGRMNLQGAAAEDYAKSLIAAMVNEGDEDLLIINRIKADLSARGVMISEQDIKQEMQKLAVVAKEQVEKGKP